MGRKYLAVCLSLSLLFAVAVVYAAVHTASAAIPFQFRAGEKILPAGTYVFDASSLRKVVIRSQKGSALAEVTVPTRLAQRDASNSDASLVFDKVEREYYLAELWLPGMDGFFLVGAQIEHTHVTIKATK